MNNIQYISKNIFSVIFKFLTLKEICILQLTSKFFLLIRIPSLIIENYFKNGKKLELLVSTFNYRWINLIPVYLGFSWVCYNKISDPTITSIKIFIKSILLNDYPMVKFLMMFFNMSLIDLRELLNILCEFNYFQTSSYIKQCADYDGIIKDGHDIDKDPIIINTLVIPFFNENNIMAEFMLNHLLNEVKQLGHVNIPNYVFSVIVDYIYEREGSGDEEIVDEISSDYGDFCELVRTFTCEEKTLESLRLVNEIYKHRKSFF